MKSKHWDKASQSWVIHGASNASNLELSNPGYVDEIGSSVSVDEGFTKIYNKMSKLERNLAWIYVNGAKGGGGSGGGETTEYTITVSEGSTVYTTSSNVTLNILINSGGVKKSFTVVAKNLRTNQIIGTWKRYSMSQTSIDLTGITETTDIELSAYDVTNQYATPVYVKIVSGAISLSLDKTPVPTMYIGAVSEIPLNYTVTNNTGSSANFILKINNIEVARVDNITTVIRSIYFNARNLIFNNELFNPTAGSKFIFQAYAETTLGTQTLTSSVITFPITVADSNNLIIVTEDITEFIPSETEGQTIDDLTQYSQGSQLGFTYYLSYGLSKYSLFNVDYSLILMEGDTELGVLGSGQITNVSKGENNRFIFSTVNLSVNSPNQYIKIRLYGYAISDPGDITAQYTKEVTCRIVESVSVDLYANNDIHTLLAYFSRVTGFPNQTTGTWNYPLKTSGNFIYEGSFVSKFPNGVDLTLYGVNGDTSGFISNSDGINQIPAIILSGESYGRVRVADQLFPAVDISAGLSFFQSTGFNISTTFKADESSNPLETILSIGRYDENGSLNSGYEITLEKITVKIGSADTLVCKIPQNELLTIDLDVSLLDGTGWYFKVFINGVLSAVTKVLESDIDWTFGSDIYLGCKNNNGTLSNYSNLKIYDFKLYSSSQSEYAIVQNYMSAIEQASLVGGLINQTLDTELRSKNLFDSQGNCLIWDKSLDNGKGGFLEGEALYNKLIEQMEINTPYPVVLIEETSNSPTLFEAYTTAIFSASEKGAIMGTTFPCKITYQDINGKTIINTPNGVDAVNGVRVGLQGTSSLSYNAKNLEIYCGDVDATGKKQLFVPKDTWLPENEFTLKADVMDSSHVNNVVIGKIVNGSLDGAQTPFGQTPPMSLGNDVWGGDQTLAESIRSKIKHTSEGFPCLLFVRYAPTAEGLVQQPKFMGIYNFNLGRYAYFNLGMKILSNFTKVNADGPSVVVDYTEVTNYWNTGADNGVYSLEINQNSSSQGAFQQDALPIIKFMSDVIYSSRDEDTAYNKVQKFYYQMANMALVQTQKYTMDDSGQTPTKPIVGEYYNLDKNAFYNFNASDGVLNWNNACAYFVTALLFGMVDSMCKNLTLRNWGSSVWWTSFYDMDTAFGLNNAGQDIVEYFAHLHRWYNTQTVDTGITTYTQEKNYVSNEEIKQYFASWWNRIWEVLENLSGIDSGSTESRSSIESIYVNLRTNLFPDPEEFINTHYKGYTDTTGSIIFNYDYKVKYLKIAKTYNIETGEYQDSTDFSQLKFLHGNRVMYVRDWFKKRVLFLDGVYGIKGTTVSLPTNIESPITGLWANNKATGSTTATKFGATLSSNSKVLYHYSHDKTNGSFWLEEGDTDCILPLPTGETIVYIYANDYITQFTNFKSYPWTSLDNIDFKLLKKLDLSNLSNIDAAFFFVGGVYNKANDIGLKNIEELILSNLKLIGDTATAYTLDVSGCDRLRVLDISNSTITKVTLPTSAMLKTYNLSGTGITSLNLSNQSFLESVNITNCDSLLTINIDNCASLKGLNIPSNVQTIIIKNCEQLSTLDIPYSSNNNSISPLVSVIIDNCPGLKNLNLSGQNNPNLKIELVGAWNLESLNLNAVATTDILLPSLYVNGQVNFKSLKSLNISYTNIKSLKYNDVSYDYLELSTFPDLDFLYASGCKELEKVVCVNNIDNPIDLPSMAFFECSNLKTLYGNFNITGSNVFYNCTSFKLNESSVYATQGFDTFLEGVNVCNLSFSATSVLNLFSNTAISYEDLKFIMLRLNSNVTSIEGIFRNCYGINGPLWYDIFRNCPNLNSIKEAFRNTSINGVFYSRTDSYNSLDKSTYGILDFIPIVSDAESAFDGTGIEWIDNNLFAPINTTYSSLTKVDYMFRSCYNLKACVNTRDEILVDGYLHSETFFTNLRNLLNTYPKYVFQGCSKLKMIIDEDADGNTLLFHSINQPQQNIVLDDSLYAGIQLVGKIKNNTFGGITKNLPNYYIPTITSIQSPFSNSSNDELIFNFGELESIFGNIGPQLLQLKYVFLGCKLEDTAGSDIIPPKIFSTCGNLNSIEGMFSLGGLRNGGQIYEFPPTYEDSGNTYSMFHNCVNLKSIKSLFSGANQLKIKLVGERFRNCKLTDVSYAFSNSGLFGVIPYRLFFMDKLETDGTRSLVKTIENMEGVFSGCWCLGYDSTREIALNIPLSTLYNTYTTWSDRIVSITGNPVSYKLDMTEIPKVYDYVNKVDGVFDTWYLDGYGWEGATSTTDQATLDALKTSLYDSYFVYDERQKQVIIDQNNLERFIETRQNYAIPTDLFRYCSPICTLTNVLSGLTWKATTLEMNEATGEYSVITTETLDGTRGRIPMRLLEELTSTTIIDGLFKSTNFDSFVGLKGSDFTRGIAYPPDLLKYNVELTNFTNGFYGTTIPVGVDINSDLFSNNSNLRNISYCWANCSFDKRAYNADGTQATYPQINFSQLCVNNPRISNASGLFAVLGDILEGGDRGLLLIEDTLLQNSYNLNNVSSMFYYCTSLQGAVPLFNSLSYPILNVVSSYLSGVSQHNITNADQLESKFKPTEWT